MTTATRFAWRSRHLRQLLPTLLLGVALGAAPPAARAQQPEDQLHDSTFVQRHRVRSVTQYWSTEEQPDQLLEQTTTRYTASGRWRAAHNPHDDDPANEARGPHYEEVQVEDAQGRLLAVEHYRDGKLESAEHRVYGPLGKVVQTYVRETGLYGVPDNWYLKETYHYDVRGNVVEIVYSNVGMLDGRLWFPGRYRSSYDAAGRPTAEVEYEQLIFPKRTDSTYYNARGQVTRKVSYHYRQGRLLPGDLELLRYDAQGRLSGWTRADDGGRHQSIGRRSYGPDGQLRQQDTYYVELEAAPWPEAVRNGEYWLRQGHGHAQERTVYQYSPQGLLEERRQYRHKGPGPLNEATDLVFRHAWRYTFYR